MSIKQWYRADIQWAVMVDGKEGLREWEESVYLVYGELPNLALSAVVLSC